jgi:hypothetical protein
VSSRTAKGTQRNPVLKKKPKTKTTKPQTKKPKSTNYLFSDVSNKFYFSYLTLTAAFLSESIRWWNNIKGELEES